ncbi:MAG TPA: GTP 3',8-cyclase MoaA [Acidimicrobiales bacterium]|nr:GTP 3',8-cyclase MoaA [Acidimicrobiales bacterium]
MVVPTPLVDPFARTVRDLRISVTDRCNLRCTYCMPEDGLTWLPRADLLTFEEIERVARVCVERFGFDGIRITGGEPTARAQLPVLVEKLTRLGVDVSLTTNGLSLRLLADDLRAAGLRRLNVSCDTLRRRRFAEMTRRDDLPRVLDGIDAAVASGFDPVKVNCVLMRGVNDDEILDLASFGRRRGIVMRFIEFMPLDADGAWTTTSVVTLDEIVATISAVHPLEPVAEAGAAPARRFRYRDGAGEVGVVASVSRSFCSTCDRVRLTADGQFRSCLFAVRETDLRAVLRAGGSDDDVAAAIEAEVGTKWAGHAIGQVHFTRPARSMSQIGG